MIPELRTTEFAGFTPKSFENVGVQGLRTFAESTDYQSGADQSGSGFERVRNISSASVPERVTETVKMWGGKSLIKDLERQMKEYAFKHSDVDIQITVFDEGGWFRNRSIGLRITAPRNTLERLKRALLKIDEHING